MIKRADKLQSARLTERLNVRHKDRMNGRKGYVFRVSFRNKYTPAAAVNEETRVEEGAEDFQRRSIKMQKKEQLFFN